MNFMWTCTKIMVTTCMQEHITQSLEHAWSKGYGWYKFMRNTPRASLTVLGDHCCCSWKNPVSWMLWISVNILCDGRREFTANRDAAIVHGFLRLSSCRSRICLILCNEGLCFRAYKPQVSTLQALISFERPGKLIFIVVAEKPWEACSLFVVGPIRVSYFRFLPYTAWNIYSLVPNWLIKSNNIHFRCI